MKMISVMLLSIFAYQLIYPTCAMALTTGPSQPEVRGFEPVGTTDMVDMFSGSFVYNIPLMDVEGYPVNISYHGGVSMEQEASWVGLGWNINPGTINRTVRGLPDDFNGDSVMKDFNIKQEKRVRVGIGGGGELLGVGDPPKPKTSFNVSVDLGAYVDISNYSGVSCDFSLGGGINVTPCVSAGVNVGVGSQTGASIGYNANVSVKASQIISKQLSGNAGIGIGGGYSTRSGVKAVDLDISLSAAFTAGINKNDKGTYDADVSGGAGFSSSMIIPIGVVNYVPVITNSSIMTTVYGRIKVGGEIFGVFPYANANGSVTVVNFSNDASRSAYGYMYLQNAKNDFSSILDFTRDKDGMFNKSMQYLPVPNMTYDIYSLSGQGTGGTFRPYRNDFGNVYDPFTESKATSESNEAEMGFFPELFEGGADVKKTGTMITSGPWMQYQRSGTPSKGFTGRSKGSIYENIYFKQAGELTPVDSNYFSVIGGSNPITPDDANALPKTKPGSASQRDVRANLIYYHTAQEDTAKGVGTNPSIMSYTDPAFTSYANPSTQTISRIGNGNFQRKKDQISEIVQVQRDGRKYVYGIPAMNNVQREVTFSSDASKVNLREGTVGFSPTDASHNNSRGRDNFYNSNVTPAYAHSYLLTSVLSNDYVDVLGDGPTDDDLGAFTKFNYTRTDSDYRWVAPYTSAIDSARYDPGFWSDPADDKGSFMCGSREQWNLHSIETKNFIAEFYTSRRHDAMGVQKAVLNAGEDELFNNPKASPSYSYELDSIKLYNKHDRFINGANAVPVKSVFFVYDYSLCPGIPNSDNGGGKLTLQKIFFRYGNSQKSIISPYQFGYDSNPTYDLSAKNRWGDYKPSNAFTNYEFPYVNQNDVANNTYAAAWSLNKITLPSGGVIKATYESNDYAFVQDRAANEMFMVQGMGNSPLYQPANQLYRDKNTPYLYAYFQRRQGSELPSLTFAQNYLGTHFKKDSTNCMYFNFNVCLTGARNTFEQIKGYTNITDVGICTNDTAYGYVQFKSVSPTGGGATLNPVTYTALNTARYNLPQIVFPGSDPNESDLKNILAGLKEAINDLLDIGQSPIIHMLKGAGGQDINLSKCFIRLQSVGLSKKGGGQRVKSLTFHDNWKSLSGGNDNDAVYGKNYNYTVADPYYGTISSGVASYEPIIGGDENPLRQPAPYQAQSASNFPPNDAVDLYQETPVGESLFPPAQVGYSKVTVTSIHADKGRSSQGVDQYLFYTAKDFPAKVIATAINANSTNHYDFFSQKNLLTATQGYTLIFNDMHGKPKRVEHDVYNPVSQTLQPITYQIYNYRQKGNKLDNVVPCMVYNGSDMIVQNRQLGIEEDITMDARQKNEDTHSSTKNINVNDFIIPIGIFPAPIAIGLTYSWASEYQNEFQSAAVTKVVQQYGILDNVVSFNENAITTLRNEIYDFATGQPVVTSTTNEYMDKEYTTNIPAYWVYDGMGAASTNIGYTDTGTITVGSNNIGTLNILNTSALVPGDNLLISYKDGSGNKQQTTAWVMGMLPTYTVDSLPILTSVTLYNLDSVLVHRTVYDTISSITSTSRTKYCISPQTYAMDAYNDSGYITTGAGTFRTDTLSGPVYYGNLQINIDTCVYDAFSFPAILSNFTGAIFVFDGATLPGCPYIDGTTYCCGPDAGPVTMYFNPSSSGFKFTGTVLLPAQCSRPYFAATVNFPLYANLAYTATPITSYDTTYAYSSHLAYVDSYYHAPYVIYDTIGYTYTSHANCLGSSVLPRFPQNTPGWVSGATLSNVSLQVISSGHSNMLSENVESYSSMDYPAPSNILSTSLTDLISLKAKTFADSNTMVSHHYLAVSDTINPFAIGERGLWRVSKEYNYITQRNNGATARDAGLFNATSLFGPSTDMSLGCALSPYNYLEPFYVDPNWHVGRTVTKYSPNGKEVENIDAVGNYSTALFGYNEELPVAVASNAKQGEILADGFEDYQLLQIINSFTKFSSSPFDQFGTAGLPGSSLYATCSLTPSGAAAGISSTVAHTGLSSLKLPSGGPGVSSGIYSVQLPVNANNYVGISNYYNSYFSTDPLSPYLFTSANEYLPFEATPVTSYILSYWIHGDGTAASTITDYPLPAGCGIVTGSGTIYPLIKTSNIIDGWQQVQVTFTVPSAATALRIAMPANYYVDDVRLFPAVANMKSFVYNPVNEKLMATLDENNFATLYEYDQEGSLVRVKKETTKGIMTVSESRSGNPKQ